MRRPVIALLAVVIATAVAGCGSSDDGGWHSGGVSDSEFAGYRREPAPVVGEIALPDLSADGAPFELRAEPGGLLVVYFGYTNCPDFCPTTLSDLKIAENRLAEIDPAAPARITTAMVTIDPDRDLAVLADYVGSFFADGHALGTDDPALLARAADPFGVVYNITPSTDPGDPDGFPQVAHTTSLYAIDDAGTLVLTWQFGVSIDDLTGDLQNLLEEAST